MPRYAFVMIAHKGDDIFMLGSDDNNNLHWTDKFNDKVCCNTEDEIKKLHQEVQTMPDPKGLTSAAGIFTIDLNRGGKLVSPEDAGVSEDFKKWVITT